jgi:hypothetical protein
MAGRHEGQYPHCPVYLHDIEAYRSCNPVGLYPLDGATGRAVGLTRSAGARPIRMHASAARPVTAAAASCRTAATPARFSAPAASSHPSATARRSRARRRRVAGSRSRAWMARAAPSRASRASTCRAVPASAPRACSGPAASLPGRRAPRDRSRAAAGRATPTRVSDAGPKRTPVSCSVRPICRRRRRTRWQSGATIPRSARWWYISRASASASRRRDSARARGRNDDRCLPPRARAEETSVQERSAR